MAQVYNYTFQGLTGLEDDACYLDERHKQNQQYGSYSVTNHFAEKCGLAETMNLATSQPNVFVNGGFGNTGAGGCNVDYDSKMKLETVQTNPKYRLNLNTRMFTTVPYLGKGKHDAMRESRLQQSEATRGRKSVNTTTEMSHMEYRNYPLLASVKADLTNTAHFIESEASEGWVRGGLSSRELMRGQDTN
jgi:hypothetical protein